MENIETLSNEAVLFNAEGYRSREFVTVSQYEDRYIIGGTEYLKSDFETVHQVEPIEGTKLVHFCGWSVLL